MAQFNQAQHGSNGSCETRLYIVRSRLGNKLMAGHNVAQNFPYSLGSERGVP